MDKIKVTPYLNRFLGLFPPLENCWIAGGAARDIFLEQSFTGDVDIFFYDWNTYEKWLNHLRDQHYPEERSAYAITFTVPYKYSTIKVQLVNWYVWYDLEELWRDFDFTVCQFAYDKNGLHFSIPAVRDLAKNELKWNNMKSGVGCVNRMAKYLSKGFTLPDDTVKEFLRAIVETPDLINRKWNG